VIKTDPREEEKDSHQRLSNNRSSIQSPINSRQSVPADMIEGYFNQFNKEPSADHVED